MSKLIREIRKDGFLKNPIIVDRNTKVILDGHHRFNALRRMNCKKIMVCFVDYNSDKIRVYPRGKMKVTKEKIINAGLSGKKLKAKTTKHMIPNRPVNICLDLKYLK